MCGISAKAALAWYGEAPAYVAKRPTYCRMWSVLKCRSAKSFRVLSFIPASTAPTPRFATRVMKPAMPSKGASRYGSPAARQMAADSS